MGCLRGSRNLVIRYLVSLVLATAFLVVPKAVLCNESELIEHAGVEGIFFPLEVGTRLLRDISICQLNKDRIKLLERKLVLKSEILADLHTQFKSSIILVDTFKSSANLEKELRDTDREFYERKLNAKSSWVKSPRLWFSVGFILASVLAVGLTFGLKSGGE